MQNVVWIDFETPSKLIVTDNYITWNSRRRRLSFPWTDVIGGKIGLSPKYFTVMVYHRQKDKFKVYRLKHSTQAFAEEVVEKINQKVSQPERNFAVFVNPISGNKKSKEVYNNWVSNILDYADVRNKLFDLDQPKYFESFNLQELDDCTDILCVGGDGTMQELLTVLHNSGADIKRWKFSIVPTGSQNALSCELNGRTLTGALLALVKGHAQLCDLMKIVIENKEIIATTAVAWGLVSDISEIAENYRVLGALRYEITGFLRIFKEWKSYSCEVLADGTTQSADYLCVMVGNHCAKNLTGNEIVFPNGDIKDGHLDLEIIDAVGRIKTGKIFSKLRNGGLHIKSKKVHYSKTKEVTINAINHNVFNIDGEIFYGKKAHITILPEHAHFLMK
jgi:diacylglycerol kinase family enzyme